MADPALPLDDDFPDEPDISHLEIEDDEPVDGIFQEKQTRLLTESLYTSWRPEGDRPFAAFANVGLFSGLHEPPLAPDVMVSLDVRIKTPLEKKNNTYFIWEFGKLPEIAIEVVSNRKGREEQKLERYAAIGVAYYAIYDPARHLSDRPLRVYERHGARFVEMLNSIWLPDLGLGLTLWEDEYEGLSAIWLRWCDRKGGLIATGAEQRERADEERQRADNERLRADSLAARLKELGLEP